MLKSLKYLIQLSFVLNLLLSGCAIGTLSVLKDIKISGEKVITINSDNRPWIPVISEKIEKLGFKVIISKEIETRFVLYINAQAPTDWAHRCFAGGWNFDYYKAELYDLVEKESLASVEGGGYSENCPPLFGLIFTKTANMVITGLKKVKLSKNMYKKLKKKVILLEQRNYGIL